SLVCVGSDSCVFPYTTLFRSGSARLASSSMQRSVCNSGSVLVRMSWLRGREAPGQRPQAAVDADLHGRLRQASAARRLGHRETLDRKSTRLNSSHVKISYAVF